MSDQVTGTPNVAVTGATGQLGGRVARRLAEAGLPQRLVVRDATRAPRLPGAEVAQATYADSETMRKAFEGIGTVFLVSAAEAIDRVAQHRNAVDAAVDAGVTRVVYTSFLGADPAATFTLARQHWATEQHIRARTGRFTFLRNSLYADLLPLMTGGDRVLRGPADDGAVSAVTRDDIADAAVAILQAAGRAGDETTEYDGLTYDITGPQALTVAEIAAVLSEAAGQPVRFVNETVEEAYASRAHYGRPHWEVEGWVSSYQAIAAGEMATISPAVQLLTGHRPMSFTELLRRYPDSCQHLR